MNKPRHVNFSVVGPDGEAFGWGGSLEKVERMPGISVLKLEFPEGFPVRSVIVDYPDVMLALRARALRPGEEY